VVLTGFASLTTAVQAIKLGAINYLAKPVNVQSILKAFEEETGEEVADFSPTPLKQLEWEHIQRVLEENDGNISSTARQLGMHRRTLQRKLQKRPKLN
jgi:two-component system response regulator RegA